MSASWSDQQPPARQYVNMSELLLNSQPPSSSPRLSLSPLSEMPTTSDIWASEAVPLSDDDLALFHQGFSSLGFASEANLPDFDLGMPEWEFSSEGFGLMDTHNAGLLPNNPELSTSAADLPFDVYSTSQHMPLVEEEALGTSMGNQSTEHNQDNQITPEAGTTIDTAIDLTVDRIEIPLPVAPEAKQPVVDPSFGTRSRPASLPEPTTENKRPLMCPPGTVWCVYATLPAWDSKRRVYYPCAADFVYVLDDAKAGSPGSFAVPGRPDLGQKRIQTLAEPVVYKEVGKDFAAQVSKMRVGVDAHGYYFPSTGGPPLNWPRNLYLIPGDSARQDPDYQELGDRQPSSNRSTFEADDDGEEGTGASGDIFDSGIAEPISPPDEITALPVYQEENGLAKAMVELYARRAGWI